MEHLETIINEGTMEVLSQELVQDGTGKNYRPLSVRYTHELGVVTATYIYMYNADSPAWAQVKEVSYAE